MDPAKQIRNHIFKRVHPMDRVKRRLSAILSADVKGYSRLMEDNEFATVETLKQYREIVADHVSRFNGRVVDSPGDNVLAEFTSTVDALECAVNTQQKLQEENTRLPVERQMHFRIGINLGDIILDEDRIYGDGVNIAARIESLAEPGGICISHSVYDQVQNKLDMQYHDMGAVEVKNILKPVRLYKVMPASAPSSGILPEPPDASDQPSIIVLPFNNMSGDQEQEYFSDGLTEDLITDLSKVNNLFVIARNSAFTYKNRAVNVQDVGREMGVKYVLEGSVRKAGGRVRVTAQLVDALSGGHLWADRYDRDLQNIFALQDEVAQRIVSALAIKMGSGEQQRLHDHDTENILAYDYYLRGMEYYNRYTSDNNLKSRAFFEKAIELDNDYTSAYTKYGWTYLTEWMMGWTQDERSLELALELATKSTAGGSDNESSYCLLANSYLWKKQHQKAIDLFKNFETLNYNQADVLSDFANILNFCGKPEEAVSLAQKAYRLDPLIPAIHLFNLGHALYLTGQYQEAITTLREALSYNPDFFPSRFFLAATYIELGRDADAREEATNFMAKNPQSSLEFWRDRMPYQDSAVVDRLLKTLRQAGFS
jgi:adenylate cyclase